MEPISPTGVKEGETVKDATVSQLDSLSLALSKWSDRCALSNPSPIK
jgi:hypothetical protein